MYIYTNTTHIWTIQTSTLKRTPTLIMQLGGNDPEQLRIATGINSQKSALHSILHTTQINITQINICREILPDTVFCDSNTILTVSISFRPPLFKKKQDTAFCHKISNWTGPTWTYVLPSFFPRYSRTLATANWNEIDFNFPSLPPCFLLVETRYGILPR